MVTRKPAAQLELVGGDPALDLANTLDGPRQGDPTGDHIRDHEDLIAWAIRAGALEPSAAGRDPGRVLEPPAAGADPDRVLERARELRAAVYSVFRAVAEGNEPDAEALARLNAFHVEALRRARLTRAGGREGFEYEWDPDDPERLLWPLAIAAVDLLRTGPLDRIHVCRDCRWLFIDTSRNSSRRWCSMNVCGGRRKMQRYRARRATADR
jgi:predicted RNA-binding Zn ribbon-like protein